MNGRSILYLSTLLLCTYNSGMQHVRSAYKVYHERERCFIWVGHVVGYDTQILMFPSPEFYNKFSQDERNAMTACLACGRKSLFSKGPSKRIEWPDKDGDIFYDCVER